MGPGRALDLGCGTGTNVLWLAQHGWTAVGVDRSAIAIESARRKADWTSGAMFVEGDVTRLAELQVDGPFDLILDIGVSTACRSGVGRRTCDRWPGSPGAGARMMIFAYGQRLAMARLSRTREPEIRRRFGAVFEIEHVVPGRDPQGAAWFILRRR